MQEQIAGVGDLDRSTFSVVVELEVWSGLKK